MPHHNQHRPKDVPMTSIICENEEPNGKREFDPGAWRRFQSIVNGFDKPVLGQHLTIINGMGTPVLNRCVANTPLDLPKNKGQDQKRKRDSHDELNLFQAIGNDINKPVLERTPVSSTPAKRQDTVKNPQTPSLNIKKQNRRNVPSVPQAPTPQNSPPEPLSNPPCPRPYSGESKPSVTDTTASLDSVPESPSTVPHSRSYSRSRSRSGSSSHSRSNSRSSKRRNRRGQNKPSARDGGLLMLKYALKNLKNKRDAEHAQLQADAGAETERLGKAKQEAEKAHRLRILNIDTTSSTALHLRKKPDQGSYGPAPKDDLDLRRFALEKYASEKLNEDFAPFWEDGTDETEWEDIEEEDP